ncbi:hypothetical protein Q7C36_018855 [Tachysurus vachellii]|uniref:Uncharacterized protein n=1 Tax=Tachysurus vachellii TaxID=175792 RepID=A0AA88SA17_TACVA|nr:hypothetical protein Q7C36_018855 [Tachysurus vachellii]
MILTTLFVNEVNQRVDEYMPDPTSVTLQLRGMPVMNDRMLIVQANGSNCLIINSFKPVSTATCPSVNNLHNVYGFLFLPILAYGHNGDNT